MGVHGLWKLLEPAGQIVPLESLTGKILAVDVSIWLHQAIKGLHNAHGAPMEAAPLIVLFHRLCKLLFYKIKPVFVFDGGVPLLKHQTMAARRIQSNAAKTEAMKIRQKLIKNLLKHEAVRQVLASESASAALGLNSFALPGPSVEEDLYKLPPMAADVAESESSEELVSEDEFVDERHPADIHSVDVNSQEFLSLPANIRHDILTELIDTRKQSSWKNLDSMPKDSNNFSSFQMDRLLKRHAVQTSLEKAGKEMGGRPLSMMELESILDDHGVLRDLREHVTDALPSKRIAQDNVTRYMLIQNDLPGTSESSSFGWEKVENDKKKFDVMEHLDEVEWSSESDTDIILNKPKKIKMSESDIENKNKKVKIETEHCSISKVPKIQLTKEMIDILNVLEDKSVDNDVKAKVQSLQNRFNINENIFQKEKKDLIKIEQSLITESNEETRMDLMSEVEANHSEEKGIDIAEQKVVDFLPETKPVEKIIETNHTSEMTMKKVREDTKTFIEEKANIKKANSKEDISLSPNMEIKAEIKAETENSSLSSDSESDFIPIPVTEREDASTSETNGNAMACPKEKETKEAKYFQSISVNVIPSAMNEADDLFNDIFTEGNEAVVPADETMKKNDSVSENAGTHKLAEEYKMEFLKEADPENLNDFKKMLENKQYDLMLEQGKLERHALNPTDQMYSDAQELLQLFGIPYLVAPMEAEAQCAVLDTLGLTEGTITDDSDIWLFGGRVVYKNFFNQNKHVLEYKFANIQKCFKLQREDLIKIALLVGSDYTTGLNGIGPVTALEILASFPSSSIFEGLEKFRDWYTGKCNTSAPRTALKKKIKNTIIHPGFPNKAVAEAYLHPQVDDSKEPFSWSKPNLELIQKYLKMKVGWSADKCKELLNPVFKKLEESKSQGVIDKYFKINMNTNTAVGSMSKRVEKAVKLLSAGEEDLSEEKCKLSKKPVKKRNTRSISNKSKSVESSNPLEKTEATQREPSTLPTVSTQTAKEALIKQKLHVPEKIPQKELTQKILEERKKKAIEIFRTFGRKGRKKTKVYAKKEVKLSESSSESD